MTDISPNPEAEFREVVSPPVPPPGHPRLPSESEVESPTREVGPSLLNSRITLDWQADALQICGPTIYNEFLDDLEFALKTGENYNLYRWVHAHIALRDGNKVIHTSGAEQWDEVIRYASEYSLPSVEARIVYDNRRLKHDLFGNLGCTAIVAGVGTEWAWYNKDVPNLGPLSVNASGVRAWDFVPGLACTAADYYQRNLGVTSIPIISRFNERPDFQIPEGSWPYIWMPGCTIGNNMEDMPEILAESINRKGFAEVTSDGSRSEGALKGYRTEEYIKLQHYIWWLARYMTADRGFDPTCIRPDPAYFENSQLRTVEHIHDVVGPTSITIRGNSYDLRPKSTVTIGESRKTMPSDLKGRFEDAGLNELCVLKRQSGNGYSRSTIYYGRDTDRRLIESMKSTIAKYKARGWHFG